MHFFKRLKGLVFLSTKVHSYFTFGKEEIEMTKHITDAKVIKSV